MTEPPFASPEIAPGADRIPAAPPPRADLHDLFFRPSRFFASALPYRATDALAFVAWIVGMNYTLGRIERQMVKADLGSGDGVAAGIGDSWVLFWTIVIMAGALSGMILWYLGTWWYRVRLRWSGAIEPDVHRSRAVYFYSALVWAAPALLLQIIDTVRFPNYLASWNDESWVPVLLVILPVWSFVVSYRGVRTAFDVRRGRARFWFLIGPLLLFVIAMGVIGTMYALVA